VNERINLYVLRTTISLDPFT